MGGMKDFHQWHRLKQQLNEGPRKDRYFKEGDIWYCSIGINIGHEQDGKQALFERPVLIIKKFSHKMFWAIPLTRNLQKGSWYYSTNFIGKDYSTANLSQLRMMDAKRLQRKIGALSRTKQNTVTEKIQEFIRQNKGN